MTETRSTRVRQSLRDEMELREFIHALLLGKWLILGVTVLATSVAIIIVLILANISRAEALLAPNHVEGARGFQNLAAQYGGIASLAGISLGSKPIDKTALGLEVLKSRKFISEFIGRHELLVPLLAAERWDVETGNLKIDVDQYDLRAQKWIRTVRPPKQSTPSSQEAYEEFIQLLAVDQDNETGFVTVAIEHYSPVIAMQWVNWLVEDLNLTIMQQDVAEAEQAISYLQQQISSTSIADFQRVFFRLIEEQTKTIMLAQVNEEYLLRTIDPAIAPERPHKPRRWLMVILGFSLGISLGVLITLIRSTAMSGGGVAMERHD